MEEESTVEKEKKTLENQNRDIILKRQAIEKAKDDKRDEVRKSEARLQSLKDNIEVLQRRVATYQSSVAKMRREVERERKKAHDRNVGIGVGVGVASVLTFGIAGAVAAGAGIGVMVNENNKHIEREEASLNNVVRQKDEAVAKERGEVRQFESLKSSLKVN